jgi:hypothetical protein
MTAAHTTQRRHAFIVGSQNDDTGICGGEFRVWSSRRPRKSNHHPERTS